MTGDLLEDSGKPMADPSSDPFWYRIFLDEVHARFPDLPGDDVALARSLHREAAALSDGLTRARPLPGTRYLDETPHLLAYLIYYLPANFVRSRALFRSMLRHARAPLPDVLEVLDIGCGPGTQLWALLATLASPPTNPEARTAAPPLSQVREVVYHGRDHSVAALRWVRRIADRVAASGHPAVPRVTLDLENGPWRKVLEPGPGAPHLLVLGNVINELPGSDSRLLDTVCAQAAATRPGGFTVILEPALKPSAQRIQELREAVRTHPDLEVVSPCTHQEPCPLLENAINRKHWCHQEISWDRPPWIQALEARTGLGGPRLALSHLLLQRKGISPSPDAGSKRMADRVVETTAGPQVYRAVSPTLKASGTFAVHLCGPEGFVEAMLLKRHLTEQNRPFRQVRRGDRVVLQDAPRRPSGQLRLDASSCVDVEPF